jgi:hypothetical protein
MDMESYRCVVCQEEITAKENSYSINLFNMALCRKHQDIQKQIEQKQRPNKKQNLKQPAYFTNTPGYSLAHS